ncbi:MAG: terpene cyclase/mutase family protein [Planctomycetaceae bacterium]|jgi:squalene-hopene/tetraprenyl-beta-curcumene cyclase|nr:terpene cyclase/mutase family protein [Planctomycetaceae bacterium]
METVFYSYSMDDKSAVSGENHGAETRTESIDSGLRRSISATRQFFFNHQHPDGYWVAELEGDALLQSETIMLLAFLGEENSELAKACAVQLLDTQLPDGGWGMYTGGKSDVNNTVKGYFALKLTGHDPSADYMQKARVRSLELGGVDKVNSFTRFYLAVLGQIPHSVCPAVPPQMMLLPKWSPMSIYSMSAWSRTIFVPLSIVSALAPVREIPAEKGIKEIFVKHPSQWGQLTAPGKKLSKNPLSQDRFFRLCNSAMRLCRRFGFTPLRKTGIEKAKQWILEHCKDSDGPGAIYPPIVWARIAFKALGYSDDSEEIQYFRKQLNDLVIRNEERGSVRIQPCKSPLWDTALTLKALMLGGLTAAHPAVKKGVQWVRSRHIKDTAGDWSKQRSTKDFNRDDSQCPNGWCFEFNNAFYPDCDDTAMALMVLAGRFDCGGAHFQGNVSQGGQANSLPPDLRLMVCESFDSLAAAKQSALDVADTTAAIKSGLRWLLAMQNKDGGWGAFDRNNNLEILCKVPFADHNAMIDPSTPDLTGRVMESLGRLGFCAGQNPEIDRVVKYMRKEQQADGSWFGRWGVNYIYGTWQALTGLTAVGVPADDSAVAAGANWLLAHQQPCGGWGESPDSYEDPSLRGCGTPTASQTAWAVMGLIAAGRIDDAAAERGVKFLLDRQRDDGTWFEPEFTGTGFPQVFYLKYHYYSVYFPLMALSLYASKTKMPNMTESETEPILRMQNVRIFSPETACYNNSRADDPPAEQPVLSVSACETLHERPAAADCLKDSKPVTLRVFFG